MKIVSTFLALFISISILAQQDSTEKKDWLTLRGYVKNMQTMSFGDNLNNVVLDNLIHNRLNFRVYPSKSISVGLEVRNRVFTGETVKTVPQYGNLLEKDLGYVDMSFLLLNEPSVVFLSQIDRAWVNWADENWEIRVGRQRINWGVNLFWNSNDLFNAYSLVDFDYEERPGTDAVKVRRYFGTMNSFELAFQPGKDSSKHIGAFRYKFNKWQYDFQVLGGWWNTDVAIGLGWAGNLKTAGFKGEATYFHPQENYADTTGTVSASISVDYVFSNQLFITSGILYNSAGVDTTFNVAQNLFTAPLSAKNLMPTKYSAIISLNYPVSPLLGFGVTTIYSPGVNTAFFMPSVNYSISNNWGASLFGQSFWLQTNKYKNLGNGIFIRLKGSF